MNKGNKYEKERNMKKNAKNMSNELDIKNISGKM